ncbi:hypothetical protein D3C83_118820 [compost metagenome]
MILDPGGDHHVEARPLRGPREREPMRPEIPVFGDQENDARGPLVFHEACFVATTQKPLGAELDDPLLVAKRLETRRR